MSGIGPVNGVSNIIGPLQAPSARAAGQPKPTGFQDVLKAYVDNVDDTQKSSQAAIQDLLTGKTQDVLPVVSQMAKADLSFKLLVGVRNKVIEAYKETMRMQV